MITQLFTNIKPDPTRPENIPLSRITVIAGDHGMGKTRWEQALRFLLTGTVADTALRHGKAVKEKGALLRLTQPTESKLYAKGIQGGKAAERSMAITRDAKGVPHGSTVIGGAWGLDDSAFPIPAIEESLLQKPDEVRSRYLERIVGTADPKGIQRSLNRVTGDLATENLTNLVTLRALREGREWADSQSTLVATELRKQEGAASIIEGTLPEKPHENRRDYYAAMRDLCQGWLVTKRASTRLTQLADLQRNVRENLDRAYPDPGEEPFVGPVPEAPQAPVIAAPAVLPVAPAPVNNMEAAGAVQRQIMANPTAPCVACGGPVDFRLFAKALQGTAPVAPPPPPPVVAPAADPALAAFQQQYAIYQALMGAYKVRAEVHQAWAQKKAQRAAGQAHLDQLATEERLRQQEVAAGTSATEGHVGQVQAAMTLIGDADLLGEAPATVLAALQAAPEHLLLEAIGDYNRKIEQDVRTLAQWATREGMSTQLAANRERLPRLQRVVEALDGAIKDQMEDGLTAFLGQMGQYMVPGWEPVILLADERGSDAFTLCLRENGHLCYEPSGVQTLNLLFAFAVVLAERSGRTDLMVLTAPTECLISGKMLPGLTKALANTPPWVQILLTTTTPAGDIKKLHKDIRLIDLAKLVPAGGVKSEATPEASGASDADIPGVFVQNNAPQTNAPLGLDADPGDGD